MPIRQTNPASDTESAAAVLGLDLTTLAAARPNASMAALDDTLSEKNAAGLTAVATRNVLSLLKRHWRAFGEWRQRQSSRATLHDLSDRELKDIGVTRDEIDHIAPHRAIDALRDGTTHLWIRSRGVM